MTAKRKIRDAQDARQCLEAAQASGKGRQAWAQKHGIDGRSLYAWEKKLAFSEAQPPKCGGLVELVPDSRPVECRYVIQCGRFAIEVGEHFDETTLGRLLKVIAAC